MQFKNYIVKNIKYLKNEKFMPDKSRKLNTSIDCFSTIYYPSEGYDGIVSIKMDLGNTEEKNSPFLLEVELNGIFRFEVNEETNASKKEIIEEMKKMLALNGNAILFPYVRSLVSDITLRTNQFPAYILPTMNFVELLKKNKNINFKPLNKDY